MQKKEVESNIHFSGAVVDNEDLTNTTIDIDDSDLITRALSTKDFYTGKPDPKDIDPASAGYTSKSMLFYKDAGGPFPGPSVYMAHFCAATERLSEERGSAASTANYHKIRDTGSYSRRYNLGSTSGPYQENRMTFRVPSPQTIGGWHRDEEKTNTQDLEDLFGTQVEITAKIDQLPVRTKGVSQVVSRSDAASADNPVGLYGIFGNTGESGFWYPFFDRNKFAGNKLTRSFIVTLGTRPPNDDEMFHQYVYHMNTGERNDGSEAPVNPKTGKAKDNRLYTVAVWNDRDRTGSDELKYVVDAPFTPTSNSEGALTGSRTGSLIQSSGGSTYDFPFYMAESQGAFFPGGWSGAGLTDDDHAENSAYEDGSAGYGWYNEGQAAHQFFTGFGGYNLVGNTTVEGGSSEGIGFGDWFKLVLAFNSDPIETELDGKSVYYNNLSHSLKVFFLNSANEIVSSSQTSGTMTKNQGAGLSAAKGTIKMKQYGITTVQENSTITISGLKDTGAAVREVVYTAKNSENAASNQFKCNGTNIQNIASLKTCIEHANGHENYFDIVNTNKTKSYGIVTFGSASYCEIGDTITITSADSTELTYTAAASEDKDLRQFKTHSHTSPETGAWSRTAASLQACINHQVDVGIGVVLPTHKNKFDFHPNALPPNEAGVSVTLPRTTKGRFVIINKTPGTAGNIPMSTTGSKPPDIVGIAGGTDAVGIQLTNKGAGEEGNVDIVFYEPPIIRIPPNLPVSVNGFFGGTTSASAIGWQADFNGDSFPSYCTIWTLNEAMSGDYYTSGSDVKFTSAAETGSRTITVRDRIGYHYDPFNGANGREDTHAEVYIDGIEIRGFENTVNNSTMGWNNPNPTSAQIKSSDDSISLLNLRQGIGQPDFMGSTKGLYDGSDEPLSPRYGLPPFMGHCEELFFNNKGLGADDSEGLFPTYLCFGFKKSTLFDTSPMYLFLGGFNVDNLLQNDGEDPDKYPRHMKPWLSHDANLGKSLDDASDNLSGGMRTSGDGYIDNFTRKGFIKLKDSGTNAPGNSKWRKRENNLIATKVLDISKASQGIITVANAASILGAEDEKYVIYRNRNQSFTEFNGDGLPKYEEYWKTDLILKSNNFSTDDDNTMTFNKSIVKSDLGTDLCVSRFLDELYISPYRYWLMIQVWNIGTNGDILPTKTYSHTLGVKGFDSPANNTYGMSFNESLYSDAPLRQNEWDFTSTSDEAVFEQNVDYGFGTIDDEGDKLGFISTTPVIYGDKYTTLDLKGLIDEEKGDFEEEFSKVSLYVKSQGESTCKGLLRTNKDKSVEQANLPANKPFLSVVYRDELPVVDSFEVNPNEEDPFYPKYTWQSSNDDLWYGFMILDEEAIENQYHGAVAHIPLNEDFSGIISGLGYSNPAMYRYDGTNTGSAGNSVTAEWTFNLRNTLEGLAGYALDFGEKYDGELAGEQQYVYWSSSSYTNLTTNASIIAHIVVDEVTQDHYVVSRNQQFKIYVDNAGKINAALFWGASAANGVTLQSISVVDEDGETPTNIILTFDKGLATGNCKLFINGKLEDQSGIKTATGSTHNWKIGQSLYTGTAVITGGPKLVVGSSETAINAGTSADIFKGYIEEIVIYNKTIYPVVPQTGELTLYKPIEELTVADVAAGKSIVAKLFIKDYHNIRGTTTNQVASSSMVAYRKSGLGLYTTGGP